MREAERRVREAGRALRNRRAARPRSAEETGRESGGAAGQNSGRKVQGASSQSLFRACPAVPKKAMRFTRPENSHVLSAASHIAVTEIALGLPNSLPKFSICAGIRVQQSCCSPAAFLPK